MAIEVLEWDGNLLDACFLCAVLCLCRVRLPTISVSGSSGERASVRIHAPHEKPPKPLSVHHVPVCVTFFSVLGRSLLDPCGKEEKLSDSRVTVCMNVFGDLCGLHTHGAVGLQEAELAALFDVALTKVRALTSYVRGLEELDTSAAQIFPDREPR